ncbi:MAG: transporter permease [Clostridiales bacterium]|jgi:putative ABC transport system permease protein|nr:transporter permease [Clostridiales bacterium]
MSIPVAIGALELGLILAIMGVGIFISFRILNIPDLTIDGSFTLGAAVSAIFTYSGHPLIGIGAAILAGASAGGVTALLQTKLKIQPILAGILTMTALYTINLRVMNKKPNISLYQKKNIFTPFENILHEDIRYIIVIGAILLFISIIVFLFLKLQIGVAIRATGDNEAMVRASSINTDVMKLLGLAIANGLVALSGGIMAQYAVSGDINMGNGMMVIGLASIIIGEAILGRKSILRGLLAAIIGAIVYRFIVAYALGRGMESIDFKLFSAVIVAIAISIPALKTYFMKRRSRNA